jgi:hypothetical protein
VPDDYYRRRRLITASRRRPLVLVLAGLVAACSPQPNVAPSAGPAGSAVASPGAASAGARPGSWSAAEVVQPDLVTQAPSLEPGIHCSPCHPAAASQLFGMSASPDGFLAVGVQQPPASAIALASTDGRRWLPIPWDPGAETTAIAAASGTGGVAVVGSAPGGAAAWLRREGAWATGAGADLAGPRGATAMTAVVPWRGGFVAGGYRDDPAAATAAAAVWRTDDGLAWRMDAPTGAFAGGRILGVAARGDVLVAVGSTADPSYGPAGAWVNTDGTWRRATIDDAGGLMRAVTTTPDGFIAVGQAADDDGAKAWRSPDGAWWTAVPDQPAFHHDASPVRMESVAADDRGLVAGGWRSDAANGSAAAWSSPDGVAWTEADWVPAFSGGQIPGIALATDAVIGVGRSGYPDNNQAAAWLRQRP